MMNSRSLMPRVSSQHQQARHDQILTAAAACFARNGFAATAVPDIAVQAGLSVGTLYRYFGSKEDLFLAVVAERVAVYNQAVFAALSRSGPPVKRLRAALRSLYRLLSTQPPEDARLSLELWSRAHDVNGLRSWLAEARQRRITAFRRVIEEAKLAGDVRCEVRTVDAAAILIAVADGLVVQRSCAEVLPSPGDSLREVERLLRSWQPGSESTEVRPRP